MLEKWPSGFSDLRRWKLRLIMCLLTKTSFSSHIPEAACIDLEYPQKLEQLPFFAHCVATIGYEDHHFDGALIWFSTLGRLELI